MNLALPFQVSGQVLRGPFCVKLEQQGRNRQATRILLQPSRQESMALQKYLQNLSFYWRKERSDSSLVSVMKS